VSTATEARRAGFAALAGWTNVGKSTLLNRFVGEKVAAVSEAPQTTRHRIAGVCSLPDRGQIVFVDTPGLHEPRHGLNRAMVRIARESLEGVDVVVLVIDAHRGLGPGDERAATLARASGKPRLAALNKIDVVRRKALLLPMIETVVTQWEMTEAVPVSALTGAGCAELLEAVLRRLPQGDPPFPEDRFTDQSQRALAAEWVREKLLGRTRQELPHAIAVFVERWNERDDGVVEIDVAVLVERESQKAIVIGRGGEVLKGVGSEARGELEALLGRRVGLRLWVKVRPGWRDDERTLRELGLA
jgi:GTP-binding protein Era